MLGRKLVELEFVTELIGLETGLFTGNRVTRLSRTLAYEVLAMLHEENR
jgi:hypothetical protein